MSTTVAASPSTRRVARAVFFPLPPPRSIPSTWTKLRGFTPWSACGIHSRPSTSDLALRLASGAALTCPAALRILSTESTPGPVWPGRRLQMRRTLFKSKIHRATVTQAYLDYEGSVTIDAALMRAADFLPYEKVHIWNRTNGARLETYALEGPEGSGTICVNGAAAHLARPGDVVIIATFAEVESEDEARAWKPTVVHVDAQNRIVPIAGEIPGPQRRLRPV